MAFKACNVPRLVSAVTCVQKHYGVQLLKLWKFGPLTKWKQSVFMVQEMDRVRGDVLIQSHWQKTTICLVHFVSNKTT